ncbi:MAG TPA: aldehyde dehydrogenase family protein [Gemmatimonadales bacterium]|nr:aldehyde dehydrogenase family protein [Gemmatimonadales bacterium]
MSLPRFFPWINGTFAAAPDRECDTVLNPFTGEAAAEVARATPQDFEAAIAAAQAGFERMRAMPRHARRDLLVKIASALEARRAELGAAIAVSCGKPITQALGEVDRAVITFSLAADETRRMAGEVVPLDVDSRAVGMDGLVERFPIGPVSAISPFNFPLNLLVHKVAPAIAVGTSLVVKPPPQCPQLAFLLGALMAECGLPAGAYNVLHLTLPLAEQLAVDPRFKLLTFTGSPTVGWHLKNVAGRKKVVLELGGNAAAVVHEDAGDFDWVASRLATGAFAYAGQVCIKVQRLLVHQPIAQAFTEKFVAATRALAVGNPLDPATVVGPVIDQAAADRIESWIDEAIASGAKALIRGTRNGSLLSPTVLTDVPATAKVSCREVFGPVAVIQPYREWSEAMAIVNNSEFGLQAGVFTHHVNRIWEAFRTLEVGGVIANDFPTLRVDNFPYGGVKNSGFGREGVRYAMEDMTEQRMLVLNLNK